MSEKLTGEEFEKPIPSTERADETLKESAIRYRALATNLNVGIYRNTVGVEGKFLEANPAIVDMFEYGSREEFLKAKVSDLYRHPHEREAFNKELIKKGAIRNQELALQTKNGRLFIGSVSAVAVKDEKGSIIYFDGVIEDITKHKQTEDALRESEARYRALFNASFEAIFISEKGICLDQNQTAERMFGYTHTEAVGRPAMEWIAPEDRERVKNNMMSGYENPYQVTALRRDGTTFPAEIQGKMINLAERSIRVTALRDVTERKKIEVSLMKREALFRGLFDNMTSGSAIYEVINDGAKGSDYIIKNFNKKSLEIEGKTLDQVVGKSLFDLRPNIDDYGLIPVMRKVWETGEPGYFPIKIYQDEMFSNYYENYIFKIPTGEVVTIYNDVTDQKNAEMALKESEKRFALAMEFANDGIFDWNLENNKIYYSPGWKRMLGYEDDELPNDLSVWETLTEPEDVKRSWQMQNELIHKKRDRFEMEFRMKHKAGHWVDILSRANAIFDKNNKAVRIIGTHVDISERKKLETQLQQSHKMESVGRLAGGVAHDFNNMLGVILGHAEFALEKAEKQEDLYADLKEIQTAAQRSADLTRQLLTFARKDIISPRQLDLNNTLESMLVMLRRLIGEDIDLIWKPAAQIWPVKMDPSQIDQILANLCVNARDAISGVGKLTIETGRQTFDGEDCMEHPGLVPGDFVLLAVSDTGCGMDKDTMENLFEPFYTTKEVGKGTGLGLATVYGIVKQNDGFINVYSEPNQGTTFRIYLPRYLAAATETLEKKTPDKINLDGTETILLVEDEPSILRMTRMMLERKGYLVLPAATPGEAIDLAKTHSDKIHLLMTDVVMPEMNGRDLAGQLIPLYPEIKLLFMSGYTANVIAHHGVLDDGVAFIQKPFSMAEMGEKVREVLDSAPDNN